jgi:1-acyl-sn-glycerol-3-phosphate acyltransferase
MLRQVRASLRLLFTLWTAFEYCLRYALLSISHGFSLTRAQRAKWLHLCCATAMRRLGVHIHLSGNIPSSGLITANHLSYLDIMVLSAICECSFVAKRQVRHWPVFGWMATMSGTVYVDRERPMATGEVNDQLAAALRTGQLIVMFPESTSTDSSHVLPFRSSLFAPAVTEQQPITPAYLHYEAADGNVAQDVCYWGDMTFFPHLFRLLGLRHVETYVRFGDPQGGFTDRKQAAKEMHDRVLELASR